MTFFKERKLKWNDEEETGAMKKGEEEEFKYGYEGERRWLVCMEREMRSSRGECTFNKVETCVLEGSVFVLSVVSVNEVG